MGFCYQGRKLVCDHCGTADGTVRKRKCPVRYCYPVALCKKCWDTPEIRQKAKQYHIDNKCKEKHEAFIAERKREADMIESGEFLRASALTAGPGRVHVIFRGKTSYKGRYMAAATYDAIPLGKTATIADYEAIEGKTLEEAPVSFYSKEI